MPSMETTMGRAREALWSGTWLTRERIRVVAIAVLFASLAGFLYLVVTANGLVDFQGRPIGTDFSNVYAAGSYVLDGKPVAPFDPQRQHARERQIFGQATPFYGWHYPPFFLFIATALALLPYYAALAVWQVITLGLYLLVIWRIIASRIPSPEWGGTTRETRQGWVEPSDRQLTRTRQPSAVDFSLSGEGTLTSDWLLLAVAFPAVLVNVGHGQNGFLTAALLGGALVLLERRPVLAGILFGLLAYKPQFGLMIPLALMAGGRWRTFAAAAVTVAFLVVVSTVAFGPQVWPAFLDSTRFTRLVALEQGNTGWYKIQSAFSWARMWGASVPLAYAIQGALSLTLGGALIWLWRGSAAYPLKAAALCLASILATPYTFDYDMMVLAPAITYIAADSVVRGFGPWEKTALAALWFTPLVARSVAEATLTPLGVPAMLAIFVLLLRRSKIEFAFPMVSSNTFLLK